MIQVPIPIHEPRFGLGELKSSISLYRGESIRLIPPRTISCTWKKHLKTIYRGKSLSFRRRAWTKSLLDQSIKRSRASRLNCQVEVVTISGRHIS
jgi:hypothetical protein